MMKRTPKTKEELKKVLIEKAEAGNKPAIRKLAEQERIQNRHDLIDKARAGDKAAAKVLAEEFRITKVHTQEEIDARS
jgi:hypothetical protein